MKKASLSIIFTGMLATLPVTAAESYIEAKFCYTGGIKDKSLAGQAILFLPLDNQDDQLWFIDARLNIQEPLGGSIGLGYRTIINDDNVLGFVPYFDYSNTQESLKALTLNTHLLNKELGVHFNAYLPIQNEPKTGLVLTKYWLPGVDIRVNKHLNAGQAGIILYGFSTQSTKIIGGGATASWLVNDYFKVGGQVTYDPTRAITCSLNLSLHIPFGEPAAQTANSQLFSMLPEREMYPLSSMQLPPQADSSLISEDSDDSSYAAKLLNKYAYRKAKPAESKTITLPRYGAVTVKRAGTLLVTQGKDGQLYVILGTNRWQTDRNYKNPWNAWFSGLCEKGEDCIDTIIRETLEESSGAIALTREDVINAIEQNKFFYSPQEQTLAIIYSDPNNKYNLTRLNSNLKMITSAGYSNSFASGMLEVSGYHGVALNDWNKFISNLSTNLPQNPDDPLYYVPTIDGGNIRINRFYARSLLGQKIRLK